MPRAPVYRARRPVAHRLRRLPPSSAPRRVLRLEIGGLLVFATLPPGAVVFVPAHDLGDTFLKRHLRSPAQLEPRLGDIERVTVVVTGPVFNVLDKVAWFGERVQNGRSDLYPVGLILPT